MFRDGIRFDELRACPVAGSMPWRAGEGWREWVDTDDIALAEWLQLRGLNAKPTTCAAAVQHFAAARPVHPLRDHLDGLAWDGQPRLDRWLMIYMGVTDTAYARAVGRKWMVQAVARVYRPGCKADHALILEGPQGAFKSTACTVIAMSPDWFADEIADLGSKDSAQDLRGKWIIEIGELLCYAPLRGGAGQGVHLAVHRPLSAQLWPPQSGLSAKLLLHRHHQRRRLPRRRDRRPAVLAGQGRHGRHRPTAPRHRAALGRGGRRLQGRRSLAPAAGHRNAGAHAAGRPTDSRPLGTGGYDLGD